MSSPVKTFRERRSFSQRQKDSKTIREKEPGKIPMIIERLPSERTLPHLDKTKFLLPDHMPLSEVVSTVRRRLLLTHGQSFFLLVDAKILPSLSASTLEIYERYKADDGFLYMSYASQEFFG